VYLVYDIYWTLTIILGKKAYATLRRDEPIHCDNRKISEVKTFIIWKLKSSRLAYNLDVNQSSEPISR
jgi:hypothetical protein